MKKTRIRKVIKDSIKEIIKEAYGEKTGGNAASNSGKYGGSFGASGEDKGHNLLHEQMNPEDDFNEGQGCMDENALNYGEIINPAFTYGGNEPSTIPGYDPTTPCVNPMGGNENYCCDYYIGPLTGYGFAPIEKACSGWWNAVGTETPGGLDQYTCPWCTTTVNGYTLDVWSAFCGACVNTGNGYDWVGPEAVNNINIPDANDSPDEWNGGSAGGYNWAYPTGFFEGQPSIPAAAWCECCGVGLSNVLNTTDAYTGLGSVYETQPEFTSCDDFGSELFNQDFPYGTGPGAYSEANDTTSYFANELYSAANNTTGGIVIYVSESGLHTLTNSYSYFCAVCNDTTLSNPDYSLAAGEFILNSQGIDGYDDLSDTMQAWCQCCDEDEDDDEDDDFTCNDFSDQWVTDNIVSLGNFPVGEEGGPNVENTATFCEACYNPYFGDSEMFPGFGGWVELLFATQNIDTTAQCSCCDDTPTPEVNCNEFTQQIQSNSPELEDIGGGLDDVDAFCQTCNNEPDILLGLTQSSTGIPFTDYCQCCPSTPDSESCDTFNNAFDEDSRNGICAAYYTDPTLDVWNTDAFGLGEIVPLDECCDQCEIPCDQTLTWLPGYAESTYGISFEEFCQKCSTLSYDDCVCDCCDEILVPHKCETATDGSSQCMPDPTGPFPSEQACIDSGCPTEAEFECNSQEASYTVNAFGGTEIFCTDICSSELSPVGTGDSNNYICACCEDYLTPTSGCPAFYTLEPSMQNTMCGYCTDDPNAYSHCECCEFCCDFDASNFDPSAYGINVNQAIATNSALCNNDLCEYQGGMPGPEGIPPVPKKELPPPPMKDTPVSQKTDRIINPGGSGLVRPLRERLQKLAGLKKKKK